MMTNFLVLAYPGHDPQRCRLATARAWPTAQRAKAPCLGAALLLAGGCWLGIGSVLLLVV
jgi:hypothetical protein